MKEIKEIQTNGLERIVITLLYILTPLFLLFIMANLNPTGNAIGVEENIIAGSSISISFFLFLIIF